MHVIPPIACLALMLAGTVLVVWGLCRQTGELRRPVTDPAKALAFVRCLRTSLAGLGLLGARAGWLWHGPALVGVSLVIAGEELVETSVVAAALAAAPPRH